ncbi:MAG: NAD(P)H-dependent glycerol-3-phosphate dehydrogenase [Gammaproteobacteria bacterium]
MTRRESIAVIGAGSWGTALAIQFARAEQLTTLWGRADDEPERLERERCNARYLPDSPFPEDLRVDADLEKVVRNNHDVLIAVPSHALRSVLEEIRPFLADDHRIAWATKGFEVKTGKLPHQVAAEILGDTVPLAVLSGPTFATEVGKGLPTAMTVAATNADYANELATRISNESFRAYTSDDIIGVEVGGAVKNVVAIAAGISDGIGFGANTRVALISRGLIEMRRLGEALGAHADTFMGLSGMGDLVLTCTDNQSRNRRMGLGRAAGKNTAELAKEIGQVVEGVLAANAVHGVAQQLNVEMPICEQVYQILYDDLTPEQAVLALMSREIGPET